MLGISDAAGEHAFLELREGSDGHYRLMVRGLTGLFGCRQLIATIRSIGTRARAAISGGTRTS